MFERITLPNNVLAPVSPYCHAVRAGDLLFVTGQLSQNPDTGVVERGSIESQTHQVMQNLQRVLERASIALSWRGFLSPISAGYRR
jgi:2-iminobutanoate/2-iminopropanoate deaminase